MFAVHLTAFFFSKLKEDQIKKVGVWEPERWPVSSLLGAKGDPAGIQEGGRECQNKCRSLRLVQVF